MAINKVVFGNQTIVDMTDATMEASDILENKTGYDRTGEKIVGTCTYDADTSDATATASEILATKTAYVNGNKLTGTMANNGGASGVIDDVNDVYSIASGYHDGSGTVEIDATEKAKIIASNIKDGVEILGVVGNYSGESATAQSKTVTPYTTSQVVLPDANYDYLSQVTVNAIAYSETPNTYGTTVTIGTVAP